MCEGSITKSLQVQLSLSYFFAPLDTWETSGCISQHSEEVPQGYPKVVCVDSSHSHLYFSCYMLVRNNSAWLATSLGCSQEVWHRPCLLLSPQIYLLGSMVVPKKLVQAGRTQGFPLAYNSLASHLIHPLCGPRSPLVWVGGMRKTKE